MKLTEIELSLINNFLIKLNEIGMISNRKALEQLGLEVDNSNVKETKMLFLYLENSNFFDIKYQDTQNKLIIKNKTTSKIIKVGGIQQYLNILEAKENEDNRLKEIEKQKLIDEAEIAAETKKKLKLSFLFSVIGIILSLAALLVSIIKD